MRAMSVRVVPHDPQWRLSYEREARALALTLGDELVAAHHIGSTAVAGIAAKPIIDLLLEVRSLAALDAANDLLRDLGYEPMGEYGLAGRRCFRKLTGDGVRTHHVHAYEHGNDELHRHLVFRDCLLAHPVRAQEYSGLKQHLARTFANDSEGYVAGKDAFVRALEAQALAWRPAR